MPRTHCAWKYYDALSATDRVLYLGHADDARELEREVARVEWYGGSRDLPLSLPADGGAFNVAVLANGSTSTGEPGPEGLIRRVAPHLDTDATIVVVFHPTTIRNLVRGRRGSSLHAVAGSLKAAGFTDLLALQILDDFAESALHAFAPRRIALGLLTRSAAVCLLGRRGARPGVPREIERLLAASGATLVRDCLYRTSVHVASGAVHRIDLPDAVVRVPRHEGANERCRRNFEALNRLSHLALPFRIPVPLASMPRGNLCAYAESRIPGLPLPDQRPSRTTAAYRDAALRSLRGLQEATRTDAKPFRMLYEPLFASPVRRLLPHLDADTGHAVTRWLDALPARLADWQIAPVAVHGDFKIANLLWTSDGEPCGLVDWDFSEAQGLPTTDYLLYRAFERLSDGDTPVCRTILEAAAGPLEAEFRTYCSETVGIEPDVYRSCAVMAMVHYATHHPGFLTADSYANWCRERVNHDLRRLCDIVSHAWP